MNSANNSEVSGDSFDTINVSVKLRRLKIEENVLSKSIRKTSEDFQEETYNLHEYYADSKGNSYFRNLKDSLTGVKTLFEDIKSHTISQRNLESVGKFHFGISA